MPVAGDRHHGGFGHDLPDFVAVELDFLEHAVGGGPAEVHALDAAFAFAVNGPIHLVAVEQHARRGVNVVEAQPVVVVHNHASGTQGANLGWCQVATNRADDAEFVACCCTNARHGIHDAREAFALHDNRAQACIGCSCETGACDHKPTAEGEVAIEFFGCLIHGRVPAGCPDQILVTG